MLQSSLSSVGCKVSLVLFYVLTASTPSASSPPSSAEIADDPMLSWGLYPGLKKKILKHNPEQHGCVDAESCRDCLSRHCAWCTEMALCVNRQTRACEGEAIWRPVLTECSLADDPDFCAGHEPGEKPPPVPRQPSQPYDFSPECAGLTPHHRDLIEFRQSMANGTIPKSQMVERIDGRALTPSSFLREYVYPGKPVIITNYPPLKAAERWTNEYLSETAGDWLLEVLQSTNLTYEGFRGRMTEHSLVKLSNIIKGISNPNRTGNMMLFAAPLGLQLNLKKDTCRPFFTEGLWSSSGINPFFWMSPHGLQTTLHQDKDAITNAKDNLHAVVRGRKIFTLVPPSIGADALYMESLLTENHSPVDPFRLDVERFPLFAQIQDQIRYASVEANAMLFLPGGWFHHVTTFGHTGCSNGTAISVNWWFRHPRKLKQKKPNAPPKRSEL